MLSSVGSTSLRQWRLRQAKEIILQNYWPEKQTIPAVLELDKVQVPNAWLEEALADRFANANNLLAYVDHVKEVSRDAAR
jgi:hypothetical protein